MFNIAILTNNKQIKKQRERRSANNQIVIYYIPIKTCKKLFHILLIIIAINIINIENPIERTN
jgi:hypothetical protein